MKRAIRIPIDEDTVSIEIAVRFSRLAGSRDNAFVLVHALHDGVAARLVAATSDVATAKPAITEIAPPAGGMPWHDVKLALMLARDALQGHGVWRPTCVDLRAALTGGEVIARDGTAVTLRGVLSLRAQGMNWGRIAAERFMRPNLAPVAPHDELRQPDRSPVVAG